MTRKPAASAADAKLHPGLEGVRAFAALCVIGYHLRLDGFGGGFYAVDVFFVLSGYLITGLLVAEQERSGSIDWVRFASRRLLRLWPALLATCAVFLALSPLLPLRTDPFREVLYAAGYVADIARSTTGTSPTYLIHTWSLSAEMRFYLAWPLVLLVMKDRSRDELAKVLLALFLAMTAWRLLVIAQGADYTRAYYSPDMRMTGLLLGSWVAVARPSLPNGFAAASAWIAVGVLAVLVATTPWKSVDALALNLTLVECQAAVLIVALVSRPKGVLATASAHPVLLRLGAWSYSIYLIHYPIAKLVRDEMSAPAAAAITFGLTIPLAALCYRYVERPLMRRASERPHMERSVSA